MLSFLLLIILVFLIYKIFSFSPAYFFWSKRKVPHVGLLNALKRFLFMKKSWIEMMREDYKRFEDKRYFGSYLSIFPVLIVTDLDLMKQILIKDFEYFMDRMDLLNSKSDPLFKHNLLAAKGMEWKELRSTISPAFSSSKMKAMFMLISDKARKFVDHFESMDQEKVEVDSKTTFQKYTNDVIASCFFGAECDSFNDPENDVFTAGKAVCGTTPFQSFQSLVMSIFPKLNKYLKLYSFPKELTQFFSSVIKETISRREKEGITRLDILHQLIEAKKGKLKRDAALQHEVIGFATVTESNHFNTNYNLKITDDLIIAQAMIFYIAGFETTSTILSFLAIELATNPRVQQKLIEEVDEHLIFSETVGFDQITDMKYLDQVVSEALRKWSSPVVLFRKCTKDYTIEPKSKGEVPLFLKKGSLLLLPIDATQNNPKYFYEPEKFLPERFSDENKKKINPMSYIPFGQGPRNCIGSRFAILEMKCLMATILRKFEFQICERSNFPFKLGRTFILSIDGDFILALKKR